MKLKQVQSRENPKASNVNPVTRRMHAKRQTLENVQSSWLDLAAALTSQSDGPKLSWHVGGEFGIGSALQYGEADIKGKDFHGQVILTQYCFLCVNSNMHCPDPLASQRASMSLLLSISIMQDLRRSNFTAADCRNCNFSDSKLQGAYFIKTVLAKANFQVSMCRAQQSWPSALSFEANCTQGNTLDSMTCPRRHCSTLIQTFGLQNADISDMLMDRAVLNEANLK